MTVQILQTNTESVLLERSYATGQATLYATLLTPAAFAKWCPLAGESCHIERWEADEGGTFTLVFQDLSTGEVRRIHGDLVTLDAPRHIEVVLRADGEEPGPDSERLLVTLIPRGDMTRLQLEHTGLRSREAVEQAAEAWQVRLERLEENLPPTRFLAKVRQKP